MIESNKLKILKLYPEYTTIYGPYTRKDGRKIVILYDGTKRSARQFAKVKLEVKLGRRLEKGEEVDHIDEDFTNNRMNNLHVLLSGDNRRKQQFHIHGPKIKCKCTRCGTRFYRTKSTVGEFCSNSCRSRELGANQYGSKRKGYHR